MNKVGRAVLRDIVPRSPVFTTRIAAEAAAVAPAVATRDLARLAADGIVTRTAAGVWADVRHPDFSAYAVIQHLLRIRGSETPGYVSLLSALNLRGLTQQIPRVIHVVVPTQRQSLATAVGTYEFHQIEPALFGGFERFGRLASFAVAAGTKALFDVLYLLTRRAKRFSYLPELERVRDFHSAEMERWIRRVPNARVRSAVTARWRQLERDLIDR